MWKIVIKFHQDYTAGKHKGDDDDEGEKSDDEHETVANVEIFPELSVFCAFVEKFVDEFKVTTGSEAKYQKLNFNHCLIVLLEIAQLNDFGDEIGRNRLQAVLKKILVEHDLSEHVIKEIAHVVELLIPSLETRLQFFNDIVIDMLNLGSSSEYSRQTIIEDLISKVGIDMKVKANSLKMEMMELKEQESLFVERKHYGDAQKVSEKYAQLNEELIEMLRPYAESSNSSQTLIDSLSSVVVAKKITSSEVLKNLRICYHAITMKGVKSLTPELLKTYNNFVRYHLESADIATRVWALKTATAFSLLYESLTKDVYVILKSQMFKSNNIVIWETTIGCIVDLLLRYTVDKMESLVEVNQEMSANGSFQNRSKKGGRTLYTDDGDDPEEMDIVRSIDIIQMLTHVLDNNLDHKVHKATLTGLCKLILHGQYCTRDIISKFLLAYFNPATDAEVNQILGIFFESVIKMKKQESLQQALVPTLVTLLEAPYDSPLHEVKQETVIKYVIGATRPIFCSNGLNLHNTIALKLIELLQANPQNKDILKVFSKEFLTLEISDDPLLKMDMVAHIETLLKNITADVRTKKNITDFRDILKGTYKPPLKFSSTAMTTNIEVDEDAGVPEESEENENETSAKVVENVSASGDAMNVSAGSGNNTPEQGKSRMTASSKSVESVNSTAGDDVDMTSPEAPSSRNTSEINETRNSVNDMLDPMSVNIPATQEEEVISSSDDEIELPATPEVLQTTSRAKKTYASKRSLELSLTVNSPLRKNPRNGESPKPAKTLQPVSPKTPRSSALRPTGSSTPNTGRVTRQQSIVEHSQSAKLTRSASKKMNIDPEVVTENALASQKPAKAAPKIEEKIVKKRTLPVPTRTSKFRSARAGAVMSKQDSTDGKAARKEKQDLEALPKRTTRQLISAARKETVSAKGKDVKQRPRWN